MGRKEGTMGIGENWTGRSSDKGGGDIGLGFKKQKQKSKLCGV